MLAAAHSLVGAVRGIFNPVWVLNIFCLIWSVGHAFSAICLPMIFKYGSEKGRVMYIAVVVVFCVISGVYETFGAVLYEKRVIIECRNSNRQQFIWSELSFVSGVAEKSCI